MTQIQLEQEVKQDQGLSLGRRGEVLLRVAVERDAIGSEIKGPICSSCNNGAWRYDGPTIIGEGRSNPLMRDYLNLYNITCSDCKTTRVAKLPYGGSN
jgi:hypothetical protein